MFKFKKHDFWQNSESSDLQENAFESFDLFSTLEWLENQKILKMKIQLTYET